METEKIEVKKDFANSPNLLVGDLKFQPFLIPLQGSSLLDDGSPVHTAASADSLNPSHTF